MSLQGSLSIERMCELVRVSRASFYRSFREQHPVEEEREVRSAIQQIAVEHRRRYGYRRISAELRRRGMRVNHNASRFQALCQRDCGASIRRRSALLIEPGCYSLRAIKHWGSEAAVLMFLRRLA
jgi:hypothetical protein